MTGDLVLNRVWDWYLRKKLGWELNRRPGGVLVCWTKGGASLAFLNVPISRKPSMASGVDIDKDNTVPAMRCAPHPGSGRASSRVAGRDLDHLH